MPHYVIQLDHEDPEADEFGVYSTVVDNLITEVMTAPEMKAWLQNDERYQSYLEPYDPDRLARNHPDDGLGDYYRETARYFYWHDAGFCHGKLSDEYLVLPLEFWRFE